MWSGRSKCGEDEASRELVQYTRGRLCDLGTLKDEIRQAIGCSDVLGDCKWFPATRRERREDRGEDHREQLERRFSRSTSNIRTTKNTTTPL